MFEEKGLIISDVFVGGEQDIPEKIRCNIIYLDIHAGPGCFGNQEPGPQQGNGVEIIVTGFAAGEQFFAVYQL